MTAAKKAAYRIAGTRPLDTDVVIVARSQIDRMTAEIADEATPVSERVHTVRKGLKRMRGLLRVIRHADPGFYRAENARYRDIARDLSPLREAGAHGDLIAMVKTRFTDQLSAAPFAGIENALFKSAATVRDEDERAAALLAQTGERLGEGAFALSAVNWQLTPDDAHGVLADGVTGILKTLRKAGRAARKTPSADALHEWRKAAKYARFAVRLLHNYWPGDPKRIRKDLEAAGETLGVIHDIDEFAARVAAQKPGPEDERMVLTGLLTAWRGHLVNAVDPLMEAVLDQSPKKTGRAVAEGYLEKLKAPAKSA